MMRQRDDALAEADAMAAMMEEKWGVDRLRLLVGPELRAKFDRQRRLLDGAIRCGPPEALQRESKRMVTAWTALDAAATAAVSEPLRGPAVFEVAVGSGDGGYVAAIVADDAAAGHVIAEGRLVVVYTLAEIGRLLAALPGVAKAKKVWPGAAVTAARRGVEDPLDDEIPF